jgi:hypothetical protein
LANFRQIEPGRRSQADDHEVDAVREELRPRAKTLADQALDAIALHGVSRLAAHHQPKPTQALSHHQDEVRRAYTRTGALQATKVPGASKPPLPLKLRDGYFL